MRETFDLERLIGEARSASLRGDRARAIRLLHDARCECERWLRRVRPDALRWPAWHDFESACNPAPGPSARFGADPLARAPLDALRHLERIGAGLRRLELDAEGPQADLGQALEDLLDQVWLSEREWRLDDRIALGARLAGLGPTDRRGR